MNLKIGDLVYIKNNYPYQDCQSTPIFGGANGHIYGRVIKTLTHHHEASDHRAVVVWSNGHKWSMREEYLQKITVDNPVKVPPTSEGLYVLMKPTNKFPGFQVGMIGTDLEPNTGKRAWYSIITRKAVEESITEEQLIKTLPALKAERHMHIAPITAVAHVLQVHGFPPAVQPADVEMVPLYRDFTEAINSHPCPRDRSFLIFTLPSIGEPLNDE